MASGAAVSTGESRDLAISTGLRINQFSYDNKCYPWSKLKLGDKTNLCLVFRILYLFKKVNRGRSMCDK